MGEYVKHKEINGEEIKIGVCRGSSKTDWETPFSKDMLTELKEAGFEGWYAGSFDDSNVLDQFIEHHSELNTSFIKYRSVDDILVEYPEYASLFPSHKSS